MAENTTTTTTTASSTTPVRKKQRRSVPAGRLHVKATFNNTIVSFADKAGNVLASSSAGATGFRGSKKGTAYAAQVAAEKVAEAAKTQFGTKSVDVYVSGVGLGRDSAVRAMSSYDISVDSIKDVTGVPHGGVRPRGEREGRKMARDTSPIVKQSRREGYALHSKAHKIMARKTGIPGMHAGGRQGKQSLYATQLREKQKVRRTYGLLEKQFAKLMDEADRTSTTYGILPGELLIQLLERRMDNAVYRAGFATSRRGARQLVSHGHFILNGRRVDIPSIRLKPGDVITVRPKSSKLGYFSQMETITKNSPNQLLSWLKSDQTKMTISIVGLPNRDEAEADIKEQLIVEYYSR